MAHENAKHTTRPPGAAKLQIQSAKHEAPNPKHEIRNKSEKRRKQEENLNEISTIARWKQEWANEYLPHARFLRDLSLRLRAFT